MSHPPSGNPRQGNVGQIFNLPASWQAFGRRPKGMSTRGRGPRGLRRQSTTSTLGYGRGGWTTRGGGESRGRCATRPAGRPRGRSRRGGRRDTAADGAPDGRANPDADGMGPRRAGDGVGVTVVLVVRFLLVHGNLLVKVQVAPGTGLCAYMV